MAGEVSSKLNAQKSLIEQLVQLLTVNACRSTVRVHNHENECNVKWTEDISGSISSIVEQKSLSNQREHEEWMDVLKSNEDILKNHQSLVVRAAKPSGPKDIRIEIDDELDIKQPSPKNFQAFLLDVDVFRRCDGPCNRVFAVKKLKAFVPCCHRICDECDAKYFTDEDGTSDCCNVDCVVQKLINGLADTQLKMILLQQFSKHEPDYQSIFSKLLEQNLQINFCALSPVPSLAKDKKRTNTKKMLPFDEAELRSRGYVNRRCERFHQDGCVGSPKQVSVYEDYGIRSSKCTASPFQANSTINMKAERKTSNSCIPKSCLSGRK